MERLWTRMAGVYGADRWERSYGATPDPSWTSALGARCVDDILLGVERAEADDSNRLPTLGQFRAWCRRHQPGTFAGASTPVQHQPLPSLERLGSGTPAGRRWVAFMRLEGVIPTPAGVTFEQIEDALEDANIEEMRNQVRDETRRLKRRIGVSE